MRVHYNIHIHIVIFIFMKMSEHHNNIVMTAINTHPFYFWDIVIGALDK